MPDLEPITREEKLWSGENIVPITREEMYIKHIYDKTQKIPSKPITRKEMLLERAGEGGGSDVTIKQLSVTANGTYSQEGTAYSPVIVNVPKTPLNKLTVTENGTYTAPTETGYDEVNVNVPLPSNAYLLKEIEDVDIASFSDGSTLPMPKLQVGIEPQQDLHGYDSPWVGGAGKNLFNKPNMVMNKAIPQGTVIYGQIFGVTVGFKLYGYDENDNEYEVMALSINKNSTTTTRAYTRLAISQSALDVLGDGNLMVSLSDFTQFEPYSNICPISGHTEANVVVSPTTSAEDGTTYNIQFKDGDNPLTVYGGTLDVVSGLLTVTDGYIASYNGETLPSTWISDRDVYAVGSTPTTGAEVVYELATPQTIQLTPTQVKSLLGSNNVWADTGDITDAEYFSKEV